jgi:hypothetical protein
MPDNWPPDDESRRSALWRKLGPVLGGAGTYGASPSSFTPCGNTAFFGALGPGGLCTGGSTGDAPDCEAFALVFVEFAACAGCVPENFEDMLDNHEFLLDVPGDAEPFVGVRFNVAVFSEEPLRESPGLVGIG